MSVISHDLKEIILGDTKDGWWVSDTFLSMLYVPTTEETHLKGDECSEMRQLASVDLCEYD